MRPRPLPRNQPARPGKVDKNKQRHNNNSNNNKKPKIIKIDEAVLKQSVKTCVNGLDKVIKVLENGTEEVVDYLSNECSIIYECRVCLSLFRSLANFIAHKRVYCRKKYTDVQKGYDEQIEEKMLSITADFQKGILSSRSTSKRDIVNFLDTLTLNKSTPKETAPDIFAVELEATKEALFHCFKHEGKHCSVERSATLGPDGRIIGSTKKLVNGVIAEDNNSGFDRTASSSANDHLTCKQCLKKFASEKSLQAHTKASHNLTVRTFYACPCCKKYLANTWSVYRHLSKVHKKSNEQIRKLRSQIQKKEIPEEETNKSKSPVPNIISPTVEINSNSDEVANKESLSENSLTTGGELYRCYVCGKRFERRVVMLSHAQICRDKSSGISSSVSSHSEAERLKVVDEEIEIPAKRPRLDTPSPSPPVPPKSGIEVRMYYEKNKSPPINASMTTVATTTAALSPNSTTLTDSMHLKPTAMALLATMPKARVVLTKTPVPVAVATRLSPCTPSPPPSNPTTSRQFSPRAEDIISRYRERQNLNSQIIERRDSISPCSKVAVESVYCSDTEDSSSGCEYVFGARDIANCIGTVNDIQKVNASSLIKDHFQENNDEYIGRRGRINLDSITRRIDLKIKEEPLSDDDDDIGGEQSEFVSKVEQIEEMVREEIDTSDEEEGEELMKEEVDVDDDEIEGEELVEGNFDEDDEHQQENGHNSSCLLVDIESSFDSEEMTENKTIIENNIEPEEGDEEEIEEDESEDVDEEEIEDLDIEEENDRIVTREESLMKEQALNGLLRKNNHLSPKNGITLNYAANWIYRKINSYIDGPKKKCLLCLKTFHRLNLVRRHVALHLNIFNFKCIIDKCDYKCFLRADMVKHLLRIHKKKEIRRNRGVYMKRITGDMIPVDENGVPCLPVSPVFRSRPRNFSANLRKNNILNVPNSHHSLSFNEHLESLNTDDSESDDCDNERLSSSIDLEMSNAEDEVNIPADDEESSVSGAESIRQFHTTNMQMYDTDVDELIVNPDADSSDDKLRALMMQVIFGSGGNVRRTSDQISDCGSDTVITTVPSSTTANNAVLEASSSEIGSL